MKGYINQLNELIEKKVPLVSVTLVEASGSTPQDRGSKMLVNREGHYWGTVGGGKVEKQAIQVALEMLSGQIPGQKTHFLEWSLQKDVGMTCGGSVKLFFEAFNHADLEIVIFGAGHVANHLIPILIKMDCNVTCIDMREEWLAKLPEASNLTKIQADVLEDQVHLIPEGAYVFLMTQGHATDRPVLQKILLSMKFPFLGVIGSKAKAKVIRKELSAANLDEELIQQFHCPIGLKLGSNHPQEIAISIVAQLLQVRDGNHE